MNRQFVAVGSRYVGSLRGVLAAFVLLLSASSPSVAAECGDLLPEGRVPCDCGDTVVTDTVLRADDPIVVTRCELDGLTILSRQEADSITLDLAGLTIRGRDMGTGIHVLRGGESGARVLGGGLVSSDRAVKGPSALPPSSSTLGRAAVTGFAMGFRALPGAHVSRLEHLDLIGNRRDGVSFTLSGTIVLDVQATQNGEAGFDLRGRGGRLIAAAATENRKAGLRLTTQDALIEAQARDNGGHGIVVGGARNTVKASSESNGGAGVLVFGKSHVIETDSLAKNAGGTVVPAGDRREARQ
jgi:hypothetical protein